MGRWPPSRRRSSKRLPRRKAKGDWPKGAAKRVPLRSRSKSTRAAKPTVASRHWALAAKRARVRTLAERLGALSARVSRRCCAVLVMVGVPPVLRSAGVSGVLREEDDPTDWRKRESPQKAP